MRGALASPSAGWVAAAFLAGVVVTLVAVILAGSPVTVVRSVSVSGPLAARPARVLPRGPVATAPRRVQWIAPRSVHAQALVPAAGIRACALGPPGVVLPGGALGPPGVVLPGGALVHGGTIVIRGHRVTRAQIIFGRHGRIVTVTPGKGRIIRILPRKGGVVTAMPAPRIFIRGRAGRQSVSWVGAGCTIYARAKPVTVKP